MTPTWHLLVIGEREALAWVLRESRMAFPKKRRPEVDRLRLGDQLFLLTTRGCFHDPTRDRTRVIGSATVTTPVVALDPPLELVGRVFPRGCGLQITSLSRYLTGVELGPLIEDLDAFPNKSAWSARLRRPLVVLSDRDASHLQRQLEPIAAESLAATTDEYLYRIRPVVKPS